MPFIGHRIASIDPDIVDVHGEDCRVFRVRPTGADLVVRLLVKGLREGIADVISRVPWSASRALLERYHMASYQVLAADWNSVICWHVGSAGHPVDAILPVMGSIMVQGSLPLGQLMKGVVTPGGKLRKNLGTNWRLPRSRSPSTERI